MRIRSLVAGAAVGAMMVGSAQAADSVEVLHWWTSGGEAAALNVLKKDLESQGVTWNDMPVAGGGGEQAMTVLRARVTSGNAPTAVQMLGFDILDWAEQGALAQIARASEGSVRDALSLLDQAAAMGADKIDEAAIIDMLGQAETSQIMAILDACFAGKTAEAVDLFSAADAGGAEAETMLADMLDILHQASLIAAGATPADLPEDQLNQLRKIADMGIAKLGRAWQLMLNGHRDGH